MSDVVANQNVNKYYWRASEVRYIIRRRMYVHMEWKNMETYTWKKVVGISSPFSRIRWFEPFARTFKATNYLQVQEPLMPGDKWLLLTQQHNNIGHTNQMLLS